jgi:hypothetical protein
MRGLPKRCYTLDFKQAAIDAATQQSLVRTARQFEIPEQTLRNWIKSQRQHTFVAAACKVSAEQMEAARRAAAGARQVRLARLIAPRARAAAQMASASPA